MRILEKEPPRAELRTCEGSPLNLGTDLEEAAAAKKKLMNGAGGSAAQKTTET